MYWKVRSLYFGFCFIIINFVFLEKIVNFYVISWYERRVFNLFNIKVIVKIVILNIYIL